MCLLFGGKSFKSVYPTMFSIILIITQFHGWAGDRYSIDVCSLTSQYWLSIGVHGIWRNMLFLRHFETSHPKSSSEWKRLAHASPSTSPTSIHTAVPKTRGGRQEEHPVYSFIQSLFTNHSAKQTSWCLECDYLDVLLFIQNPNGGPNQGPCNTCVKTTPSYQRTSKTSRTVSNSTGYRGGQRETQEMPGYANRTPCLRDVSSTEAKCARVQRSFPTFMTTYLMRSKVGKLRDSPEVPRLKCRRVRWTSSPAEQRRSPKRQKPSAPTETQENATQISQDFIILMLSRSQSNTLIIYLFIYWHICCIHVHSYWGKCQNNVVHISSYHSLWKNWHF